jgi:hypothetical protein
MQPTFIDAKLKRFKPLANPSFLDWTPSLSAVNWDWGSSSRRRRSASRWDREMMGSDRMPHFRDP